MILVPNLHLKSFQRLRWRALLLLLLLAAVTFAFIARAVEYLVIEREIERIAGYYRAIGRLNPVEESASPDLASGISYLENNRFIAYGDHRRICSASVLDRHNLDLGGYTSNYRLFLALNNAFLRGETIDPDTWIWPNRYESGIHISDVLFTATHEAVLLHRFERNNELFLYRITMKIEEQLVGYKQYLPEGGEATLWLLTDDRDEMHRIANSLVNGQRYLVRALYNPSIEDSWGRDSQRYPEISRANHFLQLKPFDENDGVWFLPLEEGENIDYSSPELSHLSYELTRDEENRHTVLSITTKDMSAIPVFQIESRSLYLASGRYLDYEDHTEQRRVCVINEEYAKRLSLQIGDTLTLTFRHLEYPYFYGYLHDDRDMDWQSYPTYTEELTIVGFWNTYDDEVRRGITYFNCVFLPESVLPIEYGVYNRIDYMQRYVDPNPYSFVLHSVRDQEAFLKDHETELLQLGYRVSFIDNNVENFYLSIDPIKRSMQINLVLFSLVLLLVMSSSIFLYLRSRQKDFAIQRAMGLPKSLAMRQMLTPLGLTAALGTILGGGSAWNIALSKATTTLTAVVTHDGAQIEATLSTTWLFILIASVFTLFLLFSLLGAGAIARKPILELLQGENRRQGKHHG